MFDFNVSHLDGSLLAFILQVLKVFGNYKFGSRASGSRGEQSGTCFSDID